MHSPFPLIIGAYSGRESATLEEFHARNEYFASKGRQAFAAGVPADVFNPEVYAPTLETQLMAQRGYDRARNGI